jgi:malate dehydrogenase (oxaloacetate-decarboxylating)
MLNEARRDQDSGDVVEVSLTGQMLLENPLLNKGSLASHARHVTNEMFVAAARALSACSPARSDPTASLYPRVEDVRDVSRRVAVAVGLAAQQAGIAEQTSLEALERRVASHMWVPHYARLKYKAEV